MYDKYNRSKILYKKCMKKIIIKRTDTQNRKLHENKKENIIQKRKFMWKLYDKHSLKKIIGPNFYCKIK